MGVSLVSKPKRKSTGKKTRFEIFKRDKFTCQYCGRKAPEIVLVCDHVNPVAAGGPTTLLNLITSCVDCNAGKGATPLDDQTALAKQHAELARLAERREQIDMMVQWARGLEENSEHEINSFAGFWLELFDGRVVLNPSGYDSARKWLRTFGLATLLEAARTAFTQYVKEKDGGGYQIETVCLAWSKIPGIARLSSLPVAEKELYYCRGIIRRRFTYVDERSAMSMLRQAHAAGVSTEELKEAAKTARNWSQWRDHMLQYTDL